MNDELESMMFRANEDSDTLMVLFSGRQAGFIEPLHFNMSFVTRKVHANRMYLRDNFGMWYHDGLQGITKNIPETADFLREHIAEEGYKRVVMVGVSSGGYAAILLGLMIGADDIHAFGAPTEVRVGMREEVEFRIERSLKKIAKRTDIDPDLLDLRRTIEKYPLKENATLLLYFDPGFDVDAERAHRLREFDGVKLMECPGTGHQVMKAYINNMEFYQAVADGTTLPPPAPVS